MRSAYEVSDEMALAALKELAEGAVIFCGVLVSGCGMAAGLWIAGRWLLALALHLGGWR